MEADATWIVDKVGIERGGCCLPITLRDYARLGMFMDEGGRAGGVDVLADGWIQEAWTPQPPEPTKYIVGYGYYWQIRQDGGYEAVGAYGQSVTIYPKEHLVIAVNSASVDHHGIGRAVFSVHLPAECEISVKASAITPDHPSLAKLIVPATLKGVLIELLNDYGINRVGLFPDLEGLSGYVNWETENMVKRRQRACTTPSNG
jgi:hypothetical protein